MNDTLRIEFDRRDRTYRSGEPVRGTLVIHSERGESCGKVHLLRFWRTHGRGNLDRGDRQGILLHEGPLEGPPPYRVPFEFEAPGGPFTYHGTLLNIDHYVEARVDIPGLFDPGVPEEYVLLPGSEIDPPHPDLLKVTGTKSSRGRGCRVVVGALFILFGFFTLPFGLILIIPGLFLTFPGLRRALAGAKIGEVTSTPLKMVVRPGHTVEVRARLDPKKDRTINAATAVLRGREIVISGKGSDRRVHMHEVYSREVALSGSRELTAGKRATLEAEIELPDDAPYTFTSKHNEVAWDVRVSVDIPSWPDWHEEHKLVVWPAPTDEGAPADRIPEADELAAALPASAGPRARPSREPEAAVLPEPSRTDDGPAAPERPLREDDPPVDREAVDSGVSTPADAEASPTERAGAGAAKEEAARPPSPGEPSFASAVTTILEEKSFGGRRNPLIRELVGSRHTFELEVDLVKHTFGAGPDPTYRHGRTVTGSVAGTEIDVEVRFPADRNDEIDGLRRGAIHPVTATVVDWEKLSEKPVLEA